MDPTIGREAIGDAFDLSCPDADALFALERRGGPDGMTAAEKTVAVADELGFTAAAARRLLEQMGEI